MKRICIAVLLVVMCSGCAMMAKQSLPTTLTSKEQMWIIPAGTPFTAIENSKDKPVAYTCDSDLAVLYKGNLMELEQEANAKAIKAARAAKKTGVLWGSLGSILAIIAGLFTKKAASGISGLFNKSPKKK